VRFIDGREYLLAGRVSSKAAAQHEAEALRTRHASVRIIKLWAYDFMLYVHG
jgi:hypothetical protein